MPQSLNTEALLALLQNEHDPEARSQAIEALATSKRLKLDRSVIDALIEVLAEDEDPVSQAWATVALRKLKDDRRVRDALWERFRDEQERESLRCWSITALGRMGQYVPAEELQALYRARRENPGDVLLTHAIHWTGRNAADPALLDALLDVQTEQARREPPDHLLDVAIVGAVHRCARNCLAAGTLDKERLKEKGRKDILDKLGETRIEKLIETERARRNEPALLPELEDDGPDSPLVPWRTLADVQIEQYVQDMADIQNVRITERRSFIRDQSLVRKAKGETGNRCEICGDGLDGRYARGFVQAHHVQPLSELGPDRRENLVVLCPTCHAKVHAKELRIEVAPDGLYLEGEGSERRPIGLGDALKSPAELREAAAYRNILQLFDRLPRERRTTLVAELSARLG